MRILIDESLPRSLAAEFEDLDVSTVHREGWIGLRNGVLLRTAAAAGFGVIITADRAMPQQQNLEKIGVAVLVLTRTRTHIENLRMLVSQIRSILPLLRPGDSYEVAPLKGDVICDRPMPQLLAAATGLAFT